MAHYTAEILWLRGEQDFLGNGYSRRHTLRFDGGVELPGSSSPHVVPLPMSDASAVDPEELFVASLSTCHMLWVLDFARRAGLIVEAYVDPAEGIMGKDGEGKIAMLSVTLKPKITLADPSRAGELPHIHHQAHEACFIANSVKTEVRVEPQ